MQKSEEKAKITPLNCEYAALEGLLKMEDLAEKKAKIYARLLMEPSVAKDMEYLAMRHEKRKEILASLMGKEMKKTAGGTQ